MKLVRTFAASLLVTGAVTVLAAPAGAEDVVRPICYPVEGGTAVSPISDSFGDPRGGGTRLHEGDDLMGPKGTRLLSAVDGTVREIVHANEKGNRVVIQDDEGWFYVYLHVNNDTPGTDDGQATFDQAFAAGLQVGQRVSRCQVVAYMGDSGNAESSGSHLHFEIRQPVTSGDPTRSWAWSSATAIDPAPSLRAASGGTGTSTGGGGTATVAPTGRWAPFSTVAKLVERQYLDFYGRAPDAGGASYWSSRLTSGTDTPTSFIGRLLTAPEFEARVAPVARLYWAYFDRIPDTAGLLHWIEQSGDGTTLGEISQVFAGSPEFEAAYGSLSDADFVRLVYRNVLDRAPDATGESHWTGRLTSGAMTRGQVMIGFSESPEYRAGLAEEVRVVLAYVAMLERSPDQGGLDHWSARDVSGLVQGVYSSAEYTARIRGLAA
jgi:hypothetical protein